MNAALPPLLRAWVILAVLTLASLTLAGDGRDHGALGLIGAALVVGMAIVKGRQILMHYMELHRAAPVWRAALTAYLALVGAMMSGAYGVGLFR